MTFFWTYKVSRKSSLKLRSRINYYFSLNPLQSSVAFLYTLKIRQPLGFLMFSKGYRKAPTGCNGVIGKGGVITPPFSTISPFLEIQDVPNFYRPIKKTKVLNDSFRQFVYNFCPQSILILKNIYESGEMRT